MKDSTEKRLTVYMLSGFSIMYGDEVLPLESFGNSKLMELFQILLRYKKKGISRGQLLQMLYEDDSISDKSHSLDSLVYRLKRILAKTIPNQDKFILINNSIYKWSEDISITVDVVEFETLLEKAETAPKEEKKKLLISAFYWYELEFLEERPMRPWIQEERAHLKKLYTECVIKLGEIFEEEKDYQAMYELYSKAAEIYPYEGWQGGQILALQHLNRYTDAYKYYQETVKKYSDGVGLPLSPEMLDIIQKMGESIKNPKDTLETIKGHLEEDGDRNGAFYCTYHGFVSIYKYESRMIERSGQSVFFMMCNIYYLNPTGRKSPRACEQLLEAIQKTLRRGDSFTRYSDNQFLILLTGAKNENCGQIFERIRKRFKCLNRNSNCELEYFASPVRTMSESWNEIRFRNGRRLWDVNEGNDAKMEK